MVLITQRRSDPPPAPLEAPHPVRTRIAVLDGLRLVAALLVVGYHFLAYDRGGAKPWGVTSDVAFPGLWRAASYGWLGVELFFLISGFVIAMSAWDRTPGEFVRSRVTRLFPAYWAAVLLTFAVLTLWPLVRDPVSAGDMLVNLTMLQEPLGVRSVDAVYWTLWVEARFYLLFAVLLAWRGGLSVRKGAVFGGVWLVAAVVAHQADVPALDVVVMPDYAPYFVAGLALYLIHRSGGHPLLWGLTGVSYLLAQHHVASMVARVSRTLDRPLAGWPALLLVTLCFAAMALIATRRLDRIRWRWLTVAGALTYPLYLLHEYIGWTMIAALHPLLPRWAVLLLVVAAVTGAAWLLHRYVERPLGRVLRDRLARSLPR
ncbi:acyltransferase family protein [Actinoplanes sp. RD1]|uniref:acyltransferase family protein n=1 Tax=Actinoplanes sp. RD1 TaxID=3064538 RepID=UPI0027414DAD|nr:acyltransferase [Actinoplanes sp. RD1]